MGHTLLLFVDTVMTDPRRKQPSDDRDDTSTKGGSTMRGIQNNASGKPSTLIKPGIVNRMDDTVGVIMSGSMRGTRITDRDTELEKRKNRVMNMLWLSSLLS